jgi:predicted nuclease of predicted toxin-antitoxin system
LRFVLDVHLPPALAAGIRSAGHECDEARKLIAPHSSDTAIADLANKLGAAVVSKDSDFVDLAVRRVLGTALVWIRIPNTPADELRDAILPQLPSIVARIEAGEFIIEVS